MSIIEARNVCDALPFGVGLLLKEGVVEETRAGRAYVLPGPVVTDTHRPTERVLFSAVRDANPFFHLAEAFWMLAGRNDAAFLNRFVRDFGERFAEPDGTIHGAYGHRWRRALQIDQLDHVVSVLQRDHTSRQCVLQMWDCGIAVLPVDRGNGDVGELVVGQNDLMGTWRDRPCNTHTYLRVRRVATGIEKTPLVLDLTVCCRSNDAIWGAHGANAVHFSVLQEYLAARIGVSIGTMYQVSNNYHAYVSEIERLTTRVVGEMPAVEIYNPRAFVLLDRLDDDRYSKGDVMAKPLFDSPENIDTDIEDLMSAVEHGRPHASYVNDALHAVEGLLFAHAVRERDPAGALERVDECADLLPDWTMACREWLLRRKLMVRATGKVVT